MSDFVIVLLRFISYLSYKRHLLITSASSCEKQLSTRYHTHISQVLNARYVYNLARNMI